MRDHKGKMALILALSPKHKAEGGYPEDEEYEDGDMLGEEGKLPPELKLAGHEVLEQLDRHPRDVKLFCEALRDFFYICDKEPHEEYEGEEDGEEE